MSSVFKQSYTSEYLEGIETDGSLGYTPIPSKSVVSDFLDDYLKPQNETRLGPSFVSQAVNGGNPPQNSCVFKKNINSDIKTEEAKEIPTWTRTKSNLNGKVSCGNVDKRVALTCAPKTASLDETLFVKKVEYVLGQKTLSPNWVLSGSKFYGLLRNALGTTSGLIFPYTPKVTFNHQVEYDTTSITHTNLAYNYYKSTTPPSVEINAKFTADNRNNALHMLSAIWFLTACSKCNFGENAKDPGLPPPIIYLSGYNSLIDNIPVVIKSFNYSYPDDKHYVNLVLDMSKDNTVPDSQFCKMYDYTTTIESYSNFPSYAVGTNPSSTRNIDGGINLSFWLPTEIDISVSLAIQPNLLKHKKQWTLEGYKSGLLLTNSGKNPSASMKTFDTQLVGTGEMDLTTCSEKMKEEYVNEKMDFIPSGWTW